MLETPVLSRPVAPALGSNRWASLHAAPGGARCGLGLAGIASFCLSGAVVLGLIKGPPRHGAELGLETACVLTTATPAPAKAAEIVNFATAFIASTAPAIAPAVVSTPFDTSALLEAPGPSHAHSPGLAIPTSASVADVEGPPLPALIKRNSLALTPLPPSRPRDLARRVRLASIREPIEFRLADRGSSL